jgi:hypothetical protein
MAAITRDCEAERLRAPLWPAASGGKCPNFVGFVTYSDVAILFFDHLPPWGSAYTLTAKGERDNWRLGTKNCYV